MEDKANDATRPGESPGATEEKAETAGSASETPDTAGKRPNRFLFGLGWTIGRGARAVASGARWVGSGVQSLKPDGGEPLPDEVEDAGADGGPGAEEPVTSETGEEVEESGPKPKKKSK